MSPLLANAAIAVDTDHPSVRTSTRPPARSAPRSRSSALRELTPALLRELQSAHGDPLVTLLMPTSPDLLLCDFDLVRLDALAERALDRLRDEMPEREVRGFAERIAKITDAITDERTGHGIAVFVDDTAAIAVRLPTTVDERVVVDPTYATRDLARALAIAPEYHVLLLGTSRARLLRGRGDLVREVHDAPFPLASDVVDRPDTKGHRLTAERLDRFHRAHQPLVREAIDAALLAAGDGPLAVVAPPSLASLARQDERVRGCVVIGWHDRAPTSRIVDIARGAVDGHLAGERARALERVDRAQRDRRCAVGIQPVWAEALRERIELLVVDETFRYPAWVTADGKTIVRAFTADLPEVLDDAVDEVIEQVQRLGRPVCFVRAGELGSDRIAAVLIDR